MSLFRDQLPAPTSADQHHPCGCMVAVVDLLGHRIGCPATLPAPAIVDLVTHTRVTFDRIGHPSQGAPAPLDIPSSDPDEIAETVYRYARQRLASQDVEVVVDMDDMTAHIFAGLRCAGRGEIEHTSPEVWL